MTSAPSPSPGRRGRQPLDERAGTSRRCTDAASRAARDRCRSAAGCADAARPRGSRVTTSSSSAREVRGQHGREPDPAQRRGRRQRAQQRRQRRARHEVGAVVAEIDAGQHDLGMPELDEAPRVVEHDRGLEAAAHPARARHDAERAAMLAAFLDLEERARTRRGTRERAASPAASRRAMSDTSMMRAVRSARAPSAASNASTISGSRCLSALPTTTSTPRSGGDGPRDRSAPSTPSRRRGRRGCGARARRIIWRSETSARPVTVHVFTTTTSARTSRTAPCGSRAPRGAPRSPASRPGSAGSRASRRRRSARSRRNELAQLPARGADVLALAPPHGRRDARVQEHLLEGEDARQRRPLEAARPPSR